MDTLSVEWGGRRMSGERLELSWQQWSWESWRRLEGEQGTILAAGSLGWNMKVVRRWAWRQVISGFKSLLMKWTECQRRHTCPLWVPVGSVKRESRPGGWGSRDSNGPKRVDVFNRHLKYFSWLYFLVLWILVIDLCFGYHNQDIEHFLMDVSKENYCSILREHI